MINWGEKNENGEEVDIFRYHSWEVSPAKAREIQEELRPRAIFERSFEPLELERVAGGDASYSKRENRVYAAVAVFTYPQLELLEEKVVSLGAAFPYIPGLLAFREGPALIRAFKKIRHEPDLILFDGQGIAHPRGMGLATHLGILLDKPTIGVAKTCLTGNYQEPLAEVGSYSFLVEKSRKIGAVLRTRAGVKPVFVSVGNQIDLKTALDIVVDCLRGFRLPEPLRQAHLLSNRSRLGKGNFNPPL